MHDGITSSAERRGLPRAEIVGLDGIEEVAELPDPRRGARADVVANSEGDHRAVLGRGDVEDVLGGLEVGLPGLLGLDNLLRRRLGDAAEQVGG